MSRLEDLKEQIKASIDSVGQKIQETSLYINAKDRYDTMNPASQKITRLVVGFLIVLILVFYPMSLFFSSQSTINAFEEKRNLIRELFKTYRESSSRPDISVPPQMESLKSTINSIIATADLTPEQIMGVNVASFEGNLIPQTLVNNILEVKLAKLNIKQIVDIGTSIIGISNSVKMKDMAITPHPADPRYSDVTFKLYSLNVPEVAPEPPPEVEAKPKKGSSKDTIKKGDDE